jgi:hypothetical protein
LVALLGTIELAWEPGCTTTLVRNLTAERTGNVSVLIINDTPYRASFSYATWDSWDRNPPGTIDFKQLRLEGRSNSGPVALTCARNLAIGTAEMNQRALDNNAHQQTGFDADAFDTVVHFSDAATDSSLAAIATVGTAEGIEKLLGVDYTCADQVIFTFVEDPAVKGGFRIDFTVIIDAVVH